MITFAHADHFQASFPGLPSEFSRALVVRATNHESICVNAVQELREGLMISLLGAVIVQMIGFDVEAGAMQFQGLDDSGTPGTLTRTGSVGANGTTLSVVVPALARTGTVTVLGSGTSRTLQVVPVLRAFGGTVAAGNTLVLEGTGLTTNDLAIAIDGRGVGSFSLRTVVDVHGTGEVGTTWRDLTAVGARPAMIVTSAQRPEHWQEAGVWRGLTAHLRLDFTHNEPLSPATRSEIEEISNLAIRSDYEVVTREMGLDEAKALEAKRKAEEAMANQTARLDYAKAQAELMEAVAQLAAIQRLRKRGH